jgi:hypothetical protein
MDVHRDGPPVLVFIKTKVGLKGSWLDNILSLSCLGSAPDRSPPHKTHFSASSLYLETSVIPIVLRLANRTKLLQPVWPVAVVGFRLVVLPAVLLMRRLRIAISQQKGQYYAD